MNVSEHIVPKRTYYQIFAALMVFTYITVQVAFFDLGALNNVLMLGIAITKAAEAFVEAFQKGDAKAVAAAWAEDGEVRDQAGDQI